MFNEEKRYISNGVNSKVNILLQVTLWNMVNELKKKSEIELDYLQVFRIKKRDKELIIEHSQEVEQYKKVHVFKGVSNLIEEDLKVFIIDENSYNIMILSEEY